MSKAFNNKIKLNDIVSVTDFGAVGDGVTDDTAAIQAALDAGGVITLPQGTYRVTAALVMTVFGTSMRGVGRLGSVQILVDHTAGHGVVLANGYQSLDNLLIYASSSRAAATTNTGLSGVCVGGISAGSNYLTATVLRKVIVRYHPGIGVYMGAEGAGSVFEQVSSDYNKHHGFAFDDGTIGSSSPTRRCGIVTLNSCRAAENGGNGINISETGSTCYRFRVDQFETLSNGWNTSEIVGLRDAQAIVRGQNITLNECGWDDQLFGNTTTAGATVRASKAQASDGVQVMNGSTEVIENNNRFLTVTRCMYVRTGVNGLLINDAYADPTKSIGFRIESGVGALVIRLSSVASYTTPIYTDTSGIVANIAGVDSALAVASSARFLIGATVEAAIASNAVNATASTVFVTGQGGMADDLQAINLSGGSIKVPSGMQVMIVNRNAYNITVKHGLTNIYTKTGADVVLGTNQAITLVSDGTNCYEV